VVTPQLMNMRPQLAPLFGPLVNPGTPFAPPPDLQLIYAGEEPGGLPYLVYKFLP